MNYHKTGTRGKWIIENHHSAQLSKYNDKYSRVELHWFRDEKDINARGRIVTVTREMTDTFVIQGHGRKAIENIVKLIEQGCFHG